MKTLYEQLGVTPQASQNAIQQSFLRLARKFDPDNPVNLGRADACAQYRAVHDAYRTLADPATRRQYDRGLQTQSRLREPRAGTFAAKT